MRLEFAPMEGITGRVFREAHAACFPGVDRYCLPFLSPTQVRQLTPKQLRELEPGPLERERLLPQILTRVPEDFLWCAGALRDLGYREVNLNLGCPSGTVVGKGKGSGLLRDPVFLDRFLDRIFSDSPVSVSVKTRIGLEDPAEFDRILPVLERYPAASVTVHPRTRRALYAGPVHPEAYAAAYEALSCPLYYNGNLLTPADVLNLQRDFPRTAGAMIGRGLLADPSLITRCKGGTRDRDAILRFHNRICEAYLETMHPNQAVLPKLKELWQYLALLFPDNGEWKQLRKAGRWEDFYPLTQELLRSRPMLPEADFSRLNQLPYSEALLHPANR